MVYTGATEERRRSTVAGKSSAMNSERGGGKPLHNFNFAWDLKWGSQRHLRCMKVESDADSGGEAFDHHRRSRLESSSSRRRDSEFGRARRQQQPPRIEEDDEEEEEEEEGIDAVREKLMNEFKTAADKMKDAIFRGGEERPQQQQHRKPAVDAVMTEAAAAEEDEEEEEEAEGEGEEGHVVEGGSSASAAAAASAAAGSPSAAASAAALRPWNLRTRRAACKAPPPISKGLRIEEKRNDGGGGGGTSNVGAKSPRLMRGASGSGQPEKERPKFSLTLTKKEIEEDFIKMLGHRPPRRPKRRLRAVQRQLDSLFPGSWLTEVSADSYKVPEFPENVKR